jgi:hypothetical protein
VRIVLALLVVLFAGCLSSVPPAATVVPIAPLAWGPDCAIRQGDAPADICAAFLSPTKERHREANVAVDPHDAHRVVVSWTQTTTTFQVFVGTSVDGGRTWKTGPLIDPGNNDANPTNANRYSFDAIAGVAPTGEFLVFYGGEYIQPVGTFLRMTVAVSADNGATWTQRYVTKDPFALAWDFMDMAVSPDTGHLHVVAQSVSTPGIYYWRSEDQGRTWTAPDRVFEVTAANAKVPRVAAAAGGHVVVTMTLLTGGAVSALRVSHDDGRMFSSVQGLPGASGGAGDPAALRIRGNGKLQIDLVYSVGRSYSLYRSVDGGAAFAPPMDLGPLPEGVSAIWAASVLGADGTLHVLETYGNPNTPTWGAQILHLRSDGDKNWTTVSGLVPKMQPRGTGAGDDYGGLAVGTDGSVWAAWSDPRPVNNQIGVLRLVAPQN